MYMQRAGLPGRCSLGVCCAIYAISIYEQHPTSKLPVFASSLKQIPLDTPCLELMGAQQHLCATMPPCGIGSRENEDVFQMDSPKCELGSIYMCRCRRFFLPIRRENLWFGGHADDNIARLHFTTDVYNTPLI